MIKYNDLILKHFYQPANVGTLDVNAKNVGTGIIGGPLQVAMMQLQIKVSQQSIIEEVKYKVLGCVSAIAVLSWLSERLLGLTLLQAQALTNNDIQDSLDLPDTEKYCAFLAEDVIRAAIADFSAKRFCIRSVG